MALNSNIQKYYFVLVLIIIMLSASSYKEVVIFHKEVFTDTFPIPRNYDEMLFYIQRTPNSNTIVYELNTDVQGRLIVDDPIHVYWIRYQEKGHKEELSYIQKKYAYGIKSTLIDKKLGTYEVEFVSYNDRKLYLVKSPSSKQYKIYTQINGKYSILKRIFLHIKGGSFWFPKITSVEIKGVNPLTSAEIKEVFKP